MHGFTNIAVLLLILCSTTMLMVECKNKAKLGIKHGEHWGVKCGVLPNKATMYDLQNGGVMPFAQIPWQAAIFYKNDKTFLCSGTLISAQYVVTSAFCMLTVEGDGRIEIRLGDWDLSNPVSTGEIYPHFTTTITKTILYPESTAAQMRMPLIALLQLKEPVDFEAYPHIAPICLPSIQIFKKWSQTANEDKLCFVSGWGYQTPALKVEAEMNMELSRSHEERPFVKPMIQYNPQYRASFGTDQDEVLNETKPTLNDTKSTLNRAKSTLNEIKSEDSGPLYRFVPMIPSTDQIASYFNSFANPDKPDESVFIPMTHDIPEGATVDESIKDPPPHIRRTKNPDPILEYEHDDLTGIGKDDLSPPTHTHMDSVFERNIPTTEMEENYTSYFSFSSSEPRVEMTKEQKENQMELLEKVAAELHRHKEKYVNGKKRGAAEKRARMEAMARELDRHGHHLHKRSARKQELSPQLAPIVAPKHTPPRSATFLKWEVVSVQEPCYELANIDMDVGPVGKSCVAPADNNKPYSLCLADMGSPVSCIGISKTSNETSKSKDGKGYTELPQKPAYLGSIVTWKRPCVPDNTDPFPKVTVIAPTFKVLSFLQKYV